jgi:hypothetical protein
MSGELNALAVFPPERAPGTHWIGGSVGPQSGLDNMEKRGISCPLSGVEPRPSSYCTYCAVFNDIIYVFSYSYEVFHSVWIICGPWTSIKYAVCLMRISALRFQRVPQLRTPVTEFEVMKVTCAVTLVWKQLATDRRGYLCTNLLQVM